MPYMRQPYSNSLWEHFESSLAPSVFHTNDVVGELKLKKVQRVKKTKIYPFAPQNDWFLWFLERQNSSPTASTNCGSSIYGCNLTPRKPLNS